MAHLQPLATTADLTARSIESTTESETFLDSASAEVRSAAGVPISRETFTVKIPGTACDQWLHLPSQPVVSVSAVLIDGEAVSDWKLIGGHLWRLRGWQPSWEPTEVTVSLTGGLTEIPEDIVDLICAMVGHAQGESEGGGYASRGDEGGFRIDDYSEQLTGTPETRLAGPMELPKATRDRLRARFGGNVAVLTSR